MMLFMIKNLRRERLCNLGLGERLLRNAHWLWRMCLLLCVSGCTPGEQANTPLRIGLNAWPGYEFLYLAQEKGFFQQEGVRVELVELASLADTRRAYERGLIDGFGTTLIDTLQARHFRTPGPQVVWVADYSDGADIIVAGSGIQDMKGLKGKRVGVEMVSLGVYILAQALEKSGMGLKDVEPIYQDQTSMASSLLSGALDAIVTYPPTSIALQKQGHLKTLFSSSDLPGEVVDVLSIDTEILNKRGKDVQKLLKAFSQAVSYSKAKPEEAYRIMASREGVTAAEFSEAIERGMVIVTEEQQMDFLSPDGKLGKLLQRVNSVMRQAQMISGPERLIDSYSSAYLPQAKPSSHVAATGK